MACCEQSDVIIQASHQSQCYRIVQLHQDRTLNAFPDSGFGHKAIELGPRSNKSGPCLVLLQGVTVTLTEFLAWWTDSHIRRYSPRLFWLSSATVSVDTQEALLSSICAAGAPQGPVRLQCYPRNLEDWLGSRLPEAFQLDPKAFDHVLNVVSIDGKLRWNMHKAASSYRQDVLLTRTSIDPVSTAVHKLEEALGVLGLQLSRQVKAIDLGAAPGGWSFYLAQQCSMVIAVDPAALSPHLVLPNVHHVQCKSELAGEAISTLLKGSNVDVLVADMNQHPDVTMSAMRPLLRFLKSGGAIVMTMKFYGIGRDRLAAQAKTIAAFEDHVSLQGAQVVWLMANTVNERTFIART